jgi:multidrug efflux system membrane fusion protein
MKASSITGRPPLARFSLPRLRLARLLFAGLFLAGLLAACGGGEEQAVEEVVRPVRTVQVFSRGGARTRSFSGTARAGVESRLSFKVAGTVRRVAVEVGDRVSAGKLLAELDPEDYDLQVQDFRATLTRYEAEARNAKGHYERVQRLYENKTASLNDLEAARAQYEAGAAAVRSTQKKLELAQLQLDYTRLEAPTDGAIAAVNVEENENVQPGQVVVLLTAGARPEVQVSLPEILISDVRQGDPVEVRFDAIPGETFDARVTEVGVTSVGGSPTYPVTVRLGRDDKGVRPGMAAEVAFRFESSGSAARFLVPPVAVAEDRKGRFVYVAEPAPGEAHRAVVERREVTVGELTADGIEILEGLQDGDRVITAGVSKIHEGMTVELPGGEQVPAEEGIR